MLSLPIPDLTSAIRDQDISPYGPLVTELTENTVTAHHGAPLDPDIMAGSIPRRPRRKPVCGQESFCFSAGSGRTSPQRAASSSFRALLTCMSSGSGFRSGWAFEFSSLTG